MRDGAQTQQPTCSETIDTLITGVGEDDFLEETVDVLYDAIVQCNYFVNRIVGVAGAFDRSPAFNGEFFDGSVIGGGTPIDNVEDYYGESVGGFRVHAIGYNGARAVEPAFELFLINPEGLLWGECGPLEGLRYLACDGLGTEQLHIVVGTGPLLTGLTRACRDFGTGLDPEQIRLYQPGGSVPASTPILRRVEAVKRELVLFRRDLCSIGGGAVDFANQRGQRLWDTATREARARTAEGDDRPLYWARVGMSVALQQWRPPFPADIGQAKRSLEKASRGMNSANFSTGGRRAFISGFDPFRLDSAFGGDLTRGNASGAAVLRLDNQPVGNAEVQGVIFPVRYEDFDAGLVEEVFTPRLSPFGGQTATIVITVSQGSDHPDQFDLEYYNGRNRSMGPTLPDNRNYAAPGTLSDPQPPPNINPGEQFTQTTLPVDAITAALSQVTEPDYEIREIRNTRSGRIPETQDVRGPTIASTSVEGSGGGFLSNEIAYRVTRLRDALLSPVMAGHVHTPTPDGTDDSRRLIADQYQTILSVAVQAPPPPRVAITVDKLQYEVGEVPTYRIAGPPNTDIRWSSSLDGLETNEIDVFYGHRTDASGQALIPGPAWQDADVGTWIKQIRIGRIISTTASFRVTPASSAVAVCGQIWRGVTRFPVDWRCARPKGTLWMQTDGNLVVYSESGRPLWASGTAGNPGAAARFENNGELAVYAASGTKLWSSNTGTVAANGTLAFQDDGNLVIYNQAGQAVWNTDTFGDPPLTASITTDKAHYRLGENVTFTIKGPANQPIYWSSFINGSPSGENSAFYGQYTNASGRFTVTVPWNDSRLGFWSKHVNIAGQPAQVQFAVSNGSLAIYTESDSYGFGSFINYMVTGPPNQPTFWTIRLNGALIQNDAPGQPTDADGLLVTEPQPWIAFQNGTYVVQVRVGAQTAQVTFVFDWPQPIIYPMITASHSNKCLDIEGNTIDDGARALQSACVYGVNTWRQSGSTLIAVHSGKCLEVVSGDSGAPAQQWTCNGNPRQDWQYQVVGNWWNKQYRIISAVSGMCLTVADASQADGAAVVQMPCNGGANQVWTIPDPLIPPAPPPGME